MLAVSVSNAGPPITAADRERIFEPFVQLDSSLTRSASGVGLGCTSSGARSTPTGAPSR